ncbi:MAG: glycosyltransferase family 4 protein [Candidatus Thermoplasmatota archaeon]
MRILILTDESPTDILNLNVDIVANAEFLSKRGHEVFLASHPGKKIEDEAFTHLPMGFDPGTEKDSLGSFLTRNISFLRSSLSKIKDIDPGLILCMGGGQVLTTFLFGLFYSKLLSRPVIAEWRGSELLLKETGFRESLKKKILHHSSLNILRSSHMKEKALALESSAEIFISASKGVDTERFSSSGNIEEEIEGTNLLYVGRLHEVKGLPSLLKAFSTINEKYPEARLTLIGKGPFKDVLVELSKRLDISDQVEFTGEIEHGELPKHYQRGDIFILPSLSEGLSNVLMEAMASGLPIVATEVGGNPELVKDGKGGYLVQPENPSALAEALKSLIEEKDMREKMGEFNRRCIQRYEQERVLERRAEIFENIAGSSGES